MNPDCFKATYQGDVVWFILDEAHRDAVPDGAITYTLAEAEILATRTDWAKKMVHEAKKAGRQLGLPIQPTVTERWPPG